MPVTTIIEMRYLLHSACHMPPTTCHMPHATRYLLLITNPIATVQHGVEASQ